MKTQRSNFSKRFTEEEVKLNEQNTPKKKQKCVTEKETCSQNNDHVENELEDINKSFTEKEVKLDEQKTPQKQKECVAKEETCSQNNSQIECELQESNKSCSDENFSINEIPETQEKIVNGNATVNLEENGKIDDSQDDDDSIQGDMLEDNNELPEKTKKKHIKKKKGLIYVSNLPKHMNVTLIREYLGQYGDIGRIYLQPDRTAMCRSKKRKNMARHFSEGWIEFLSKRVAKAIVEKLNNTQIGTRKKSKFYDSLWCMKYLPSFKWVHLSERLAYEQAVYKKRLMAEISQARKETDFFQQNLDKSEKHKKLEKKNKKKKAE